MANNSHFPTLEGELIVRQANGEIKQRLNINEEAGVGEIIVKVLNSDGSLDKEQKFPFRSFVNNTAKMMLASFDELTTGASVLMKATDGTTGYARQADVVAAANDSTYGIIVGTDANQSGYIAAIRASQVSADDYALRFQCVEGTSANQFTHSAVTPAYTNGNGLFSFSRTFTNGSGATIVVGEIGIVGYDGSKNYLFSRDVDESVQFPYELTGNIAPLSLSVGAAQILSITYNFQIGDNSGLLNGFLGTLASTWTGGAQTVPTCQVNTSVSSASVDFYANPLYKSWKGAAAAEDVGLLVGDGTASTSRSEFALLNIDQDLTHAEQAAGAITTPTGGYELVSNNNGDWRVYKTYVGTSRVFTNATGSSIILYEGALALAGSASTARVPIVRFKFPSKVTLGDTESLEFILKIAMISGVEDASVAS